MSWPAWDWASAAILVGICRCAIVSTRTVQLATLPNASACFLSSSSEAGTKWFQERKVSSRFWAKAGALPNASHEAMPAVAPAVVERNWRRVEPVRSVVFIRGLPVGRGEKDVNKRTGLERPSPPRERIAGGA